jgi:hypothetical protein
MAMKRSSNSWFSSFVSRIEVRKIEFSSVGDPT